MSGMTRARGLSVGVAAFLVAVVALSGCVNRSGQERRESSAPAGDSENAGSLVPLQERAAPAAAEAAEAAGDRATDLSRCEPVSDAFAGLIASGLTVEGGAGLRAAQAVRSRDYETLWFVSADIEAETLQGREELATWATNDLGGGGFVYAVPGRATVFSDWLDGATTEAYLSGFEDGVSLSHACVRARFQISEGDPPVIFADQPPPGPPPTENVPPEVDQIEPGLYCRDLIARDYPYDDAAGYWVSEGRPERMDADLNGIPCETVYAPEAVAAYWGPLAGLPDGLFCRDLLPIGITYPGAVEYWVQQGAPDRMDADLNGIPCETVYPPEAVTGYWG